MRRGGREMARIFLQGELLRIDRRRVRDRNEGCESLLTTVRALTGSSED